LLVFHPQLTHLLSVLLRPMQRYFFEISYNGSDFHGWQIQKNGLSVQEVFDDALKVLLKAQAPSVGCGRTDTGVHALQFYVHSDIPQRIQNPAKTIAQLNSILPEHISVKVLHEVEQSAHARFDASQRTYLYFIHFQKNAFLSDRSFLLRQSVNVDDMNKACTTLIGQKDFSCFSKSNTQTKTNICTITQAHWKSYSNGLVFTISADRFLRNMVRAIVGTCLDIGKGKHESQWMKQLIASKNRSKAGRSVPAHALYLSSVDYPYILKTKKSKAVEQWMPVLV